MFRREAEMASAKARRSLQGQRLHDLIHRLTHSSATFWRDQLDGVDAHEVRNVEDVAALPITTTDMLAAAKPWDRLIVPRDMTVRATVGGPPVTGVLAATAQDLRTVAELAARALVCVGGQSDDILYIAPSLAGFAYERGGELLGATVISPPVHTGEAFADIHRTLGLHGVVGDPAAISDTLALPHTASVRYAIVVANHARSDNNLASAMAEYPADVIVRQSLDIVEHVGPAIGIECGAAAGTFHLFDDHVLVEILDLASDRARSAGTLGELTLTTLTAEAMPVLRLRTGIQATMLRDPCPCGRTHARVRVHEALAATS